MKWILLLMLCVPVYAKTGLQIARKIEADILSDTDNFSNLRACANEAVNRLLWVAETELSKAGREDLALRISNEWADLYGNSLFNATHGIGDHKPLSQWLANTYDSIEFVLGKDFCIRSHLADLKTFNFTPQVVIKPCTFDMGTVTTDRMTEYRYHFCGGPGCSEPNGYMGLMPVLVYWSVYGGCMLATSGTGFLVVCGLAGEGIEKMVDHFVAGKLSDRIYSKFCLGRDPGDF